MADYYITWKSYQISASDSTDLLLGYNKGDILKWLTHTADIDDTEVKSLHLSDDSTSYQNTTGNTAYAIINLRAVTDAGDRSVKVYSATTDDSVSGATELFDTDDVNDFGSWDASGEILTTPVMPIQNNHYIVIQNNSGSASRRIDVTNLFHSALVIETP